MAKSYWEKLQDPRWQQKRLKVMEKAGFECECCGDNLNTLNIHHKEYLKGHEPWEYEDEQLICLCSDCHEIMHDSNYALKYVISKLPNNFSYDRTDFVFIMGGAIKLPYEKLLEISNSEGSDFLKCRYMAGENLQDLITYFYKKLKEEQK